MDGKVLELVKGTFETKGNAIEIDMAVNKKNRRTGNIAQERIKGTLRQTTCFAGRIAYSGGSGTFFGDMILVGYRSDFNVDDWFANEQDWFGKYLIDK